MNESVKGNSCVLKRTLQELTDESSCWKYVIHKKWWKVPLTERGMRWQNQINQCWPMSSMSNLRVKNYPSSIFIFFNIRSLVRLLLLLLPGYIRFLQYSNLATCGVRILRWREIHTYRKQNWLIFQNRQLFIVVLLPHCSDINITSCWKTVSE